MNALRFGMPTLLELETLDEQATLAAALGLSFIELNMNLPSYQPNALEGLRLCDYPLEFTLHLDENLNVADFNPMVATAWRDTVLRSLDFALRCGLPLVNFHLNPGVYFTTPQGKCYLFDRYSQHHHNSLLEFRKTCTQLIGKSELCIGMENCGVLPPFLRNAAALLLESACFGLTWDVGHDHCSGESGRDFLSGYEQRLCHLHLHDALASRDHLPLGEGELDLCAWLRMAQRRGCRVVLETKTVTALRHSVAWLREAGWM